MIRERLNLSRTTPLHGLVLAAALSLACAGTSVISVRTLRAQTQSAWTPQEQAIMKRVQTLRQLPDNARGRATKQLALQIRQLPSSEGKVRLAAGLAMLSTEGDPGGRETVQEVATTLAGALGEHPLPAKNGQPSTPYTVLAAMKHFEHVDVSLHSPEFEKALTQLQQEDLHRQQAHFTLADLDGQKWTLKSLRGKVVLVNFWATWCPPCRKEIPDLEALYKRFRGEGLVVLGISDEEVTKVQPFARQQKITYPVLLDPGRTVNDLYSVSGIPMSFVYDRSGKLVAESMDMRTRKQFLAMLSDAGLR
ncbi:MAG TPA: TlpA disulfide reductase family protein [Terriglobia bacterium]|nr:TlpA disulfide reductase family protein [Terriglobia bacterium]